MQIGGRLMQLLHHPQAHDLKRLIDRKLHGPEAGVTTPPAYPLGGGVRRNQSLRNGLHDPLPSEEGTTRKILRVFTCKPRAESGLDCLVCAMFARRRTREQLLHRNVLRFRGGLVFKAHRLCVSLNSRLESNKEEERRTREGARTFKGVVDGATE